MTTRSEEGVAWYFTPVGIGLLAVFVLGPFALPLVWRTPAWGARGRWIATALILAYTVLLAWQVWVTVKIALAALQLMQP